MTQSYVESVFCASVLGFCVGSFHSALIRASGACPAAAALQERVGDLGRLVGLLTELRERRLRQVTHLHHQVNITRL